MACLILSLTASLVMWSLYEMPSSFLKHLISVVCNFLRMSAVNVQVSLAYNSTEITRERISLIFELREISFALLAISLVFSALITLPKAAEVLSRRSTAEASSSSFPPSLFCMVLLFPCFVLVRVLSSWYAFLLLFFLMLSAISWHCTSIQCSS